MEFEILFIKRNNILSDEEAAYYRDFLYRTVRIGTELEIAVPKGVKRPLFQKQLEYHFLPGGSIRKPGRFGVYQVEKEHCGVEIKILGILPYWDILYSQFFNTISYVLSKGGRVKSTCGLHFHVLITEKRTRIPEIILANVWNITRRYAPFLKFLTCTGETIEGLCRRRNHNSHLEFVKLSPAVYTMKEIKEILDKSEIVPKHQNFLNLEHLKFDKNGDIIKFHYENRFPDMDLSPTSIVAKYFLFLAILLKAAEISKYGVIHAGRYPEWRKKVELLNKLSNNDGDLATSYTGALTQEDIQYLKEGAGDLIEFLKPVLLSFRNPSYKVLRSLAKNPISFMRIEGDSWLDIEKNLRVKKDPITKLEKKILLAIEAVIFKKLSSPAEWIGYFSRKFLYRTDEVKVAIHSLKQKKNIYWDEELGTFMLEE